MTNEKLLREHIKKSGLKIAFIAAQLGITPQGFYLKLNNTNEFKAGEIKKLCDILRISELSEKEAIFFAP